MKYFNKLLLVFILSIGVAVGVQAQDIHYTMYNMSPLLTNPANTGAFSGTARINGIYRSQWKRTYETPSVSADSPIVSIGKKKKDWIGVGLLFLNDTAGEVDFTTVYTMLSGAYHRVLDKKGKSVLTFGLQFGSVARSLGAQNPWLTPEMLEAQFDSNAGGQSSQELLSEFTGLLGQENVEKLRFDSPNSTQVNLGLRFSTELDNKAKIVIGGAIYNPFRFKLTFDSTATNGQGVGTITRAAQNPNNNSRKSYKRPGVTKLHASLDYDLSDKLRLRPSAFFQTTAGLTETIVQAEVGYYVTDNKDTVLNGGLGYRFGDALQFLVGLDYKDWVIGASYDLSLSSLAEQSRYKNGFEIGVGYVIKIFKDPVVDPAILCPKL